MASSGAAPEVRGYAARHGYAPAAACRNLGDDPVNEYEKDGAEIYRQSFATIRAMADLSRFSPDESQVAVRMIHSCGMVDLARDIAFSSGVVLKARAALQSGAPILCDVQMVASGVTRRRLPADNEVLCMLSDPRVVDLARQMGNTRTAASVELWRDRLDGAVVAVGNAPTALFHLLDLLRHTDVRPAAILGIPVGFIGAAESKRALADNDLGLDYVVVHGRRGGSAITCGALNALASHEE
jgi:precorrin isomerase